MIDNYNALYNKAIQIKSKYDTIQNQLDNRIEYKKELVNKLEDTIHTQTTYEKAISYMKEIIDALSRTHINHLEKLLNSAVETIFFDKVYRIEFEVSEYRNSNNLTIYLIETLEDGSEIKTDIKDNGFGIKTIIGFILQVYFIIYNKLSPILFIDEGFSSLSQVYIPYLKSLLDSLKEKYGFIFVLVAHDPRFIDLADKTYEVKNGEVKLKIL
jgi:DNA repair exonuclease SbcCD ATPase subunit